MSIIKVKVDILLDTRIHPGSTLALRGLKGTKNNGGQPWIDVAKWAVLLEF